MPVGEFVVCMGDMKIIFISEKKVVSPAILNVRWWMHVVDFQHDLAAFTSLRLLTLLALSLSDTDILGTSANLQLSDT